MGPLAGIRIIDMTAVLMGPYATQILGDMGADVIKIEAPEGDVTRLITPARHPGMGPIYLNANRNKRSLCLDLKRASGRAVLLRLVADADVFVYSVRPQAMRRLGLDYETLAAINPRLVYAGLYGFGQDGPYAAKPAYDDLIQGGSTMASLFAMAGDGTPRYVPSAIADRVVGLAAVGAITASLVERDRSGRGQQVDVPMFETMVGFVLGDHLGGLTFDPPLDRGGYRRQLSPDRRPYRTRDGWICAMVYSDKQWANFLEAIGDTGLPERDPRFADFAARNAAIDHVYRELARLFVERTTAEWLDLLEKADIPSMPMHDLTSILEDPHLTATGFFGTAEHPTEGRIRTMRQAATWSRTPSTIDRLPPTRGQDGVEVLREAGFGEAEIGDLVASGVVLTPTTETPTPTISERG